MDEHLDELRRLRAELVARSERLRLWSRLAGARMDLLTAQVCPPATADEVAADELSELVGLVLGPGAASTATGEDRVEALMALRAARRDLARRREHLDDLVCWSTAQLVLEGSVPPPDRGPRAALAGVPGQRSGRRRTSAREAPGAGTSPAGADLRGTAPRGRAVVALASPAGARAHLVVVAGAAGDGPLDAVASTADAACHTPR